MYFEAPSVTRFYSTKKLVDDQIGTNRLGYGSRTATELPVAL